MGPQNNFSSALHKCHNALSFVIAR